MRLIVGSLDLVFNGTASTEIYTLSLHDALPISRLAAVEGSAQEARRPVGRHAAARGRGPAVEAGGDDAEKRLIRSRSEEHTSELQSRLHLVCRLLLEKKNKPLASWLNDISRSTD